MAMDRRLCLHPNVKDKIGDLLLRQCGERLSGIEEGIKQRADGSNLDGFSIDLLDESLPGLAREAAFLNWLTGVQREFMKSSKAIDLVIIQIQQGVALLPSYEQRVLSPKADWLGEILEDTRKEMAKVIDDFSRFSSGVRFDLPSTSANSSPATSWSKYGIFIEINGGQLPKDFAPLFRDELQGKLRQATSPIATLGTSIKSMIEFYDAELAEYQNPAFGCTDSLRKRCEGYRCDADFLVASLERGQKALASFSESMKSASSSEPLTLRLIRGLFDTLRWLDKLLF